MIAGADYVVTGPNSLQLNGPSSGGKIDLTAERLR